MPCCHVICLIAVNPWCPISTIQRQRKIGHIAKTDQMSFLQNMIRQDHQFHYVNSLIIMHCNHILTKVRIKVHSYLRPVDDIDVHWRIIQHVHRTPLVAENFNCATKRTDLLSPFSYEGRPHLWHSLYRSGATHHKMPSNVSIFQRFGFGFSEKFSSSNVNASFVASSASSVSTGAILDPQRCHFHTSLLVACELTPFVVLFPFKAYRLLPPHL